MWSQSRTSRLVIATVEPTVDLEGIERLATLRRAREMAVSNALAARSHRAAKQAVQRALQAGILNEGIPPLPRRTAFRPGAREVSQALGVKDKQTELRKAAIANGKAPVGVADRTNYVPKMGDPLGCSEGPGVWRAHMLASPAVRAMLCNVVASTPSPHLLPPWASPAVAEGGRMRAFSERPWVVIAVEMNCARRNEPQRLGMKPAMNGASLSHDPARYESYFTKLRDAIGECIEPPPSLLGSETGEDPESGRRRASAARSIPACVVRAVGVEAERFDPGLQRTYPRDLERGFIPCNLSYTGPYSSQATAKASRLGAFEVYMIVNHVPVGVCMGRGEEPLDLSSNEFRTVMAGLHSKLYRRCFPSVVGVVRRCQEVLLPVFLQQAQEQEANSVAAG